MLCTLYILFSPAELMSPAVVLISIQGGGLPQEEDGLRRGVHRDQWPNKTNQWNETTEKSEVINLQRQDDPTNRMH